MADARHKCKSCSWWLHSPPANAEGAAVDTGECRCQPPVALALPGAKTGKWGIRTVWPATRAQHWCGRHSDLQQSTMAATNMPAAVSGPNQAEASAGSTEKTSHGPVTSPSPVHDSQSMVQRAMDRKYQGKSVPKSVPDQSSAPRPESRKETAAPEKTRAASEQQAGNRKAAPSAQAQQPQARKAPAAPAAPSGTGEGKIVPRAQLRQNRPADAADQARKAGAPATGAAGKQPAAGQPARQQGPGREAAAPEQKSRNIESTTVTESQEKATGGLEDSASQLALTGGVHLKKDLDIPLPDFGESEAYKVIQKFQNSPAEEAEEDPEGDENALPEPEMLGKVEKSAKNPDFQAKREEIPSGTGQDKAGQEGWRMTRRAFFIQPPQPVTKQISKAETGRKPQAFFLYGRRVDPILTIPASLVDDDQATAMAWFHAELVSIARNEFREIPSPVLEEYELS